MANSAFTPSVLTLPAASSGSGSGEINAVLNPSAAGSSLTGWAGTNISAVSSGSPLDPIVTTAFSISNPATGEGSTSGGYYAIASLPDGLKNKKLKVEFYFKTPASDTYKVSVYKAGTRVPLSTDSSGSTSLPAATTGKFVAYFDTDSTSAYSVNVTRTNAGATPGPCLITQVVVGPGIQPQGAVVGEWQSYTPTVEGFGTTTPLEARYRRVGSSIEVVAKWTTGTPTASQGRIYVPTGLTVPAAGQTQVVGRWFRDSGTGSARKSSPLLQLNSAQSYVIFTSDDYATASGPYTGLNGSAIAVAGESLGVNFTVPIAEWAGSGTVQLAQNDVEYAYNKSATAASDDGSTGNFAYGSGGFNIQGFAPTGTGYIYKRVRFQSPIQPGDSLIVELNDSTNNTWVPVSSFAFGYQQNDAGTTNYGTLISRVPSNTTDADVRFYSQASKSSGDTWTANNTWKWRVRKSSAGAAVGVGLVAQSSAGLMPASNSNLDDATATRLGLKQYLHGGSYFGGLAPTVTSAQAGFAVTRAVFVPYQCQDGSWRLKFNITSSFTSATVSSMAISINGVTFKNVSNCYQSMSGFINGNLQQSYANPGASTLTIIQASTAGAIYWCGSGDIELETRPTWAYS